MSMAMPRGFRWHVWPTRKETHRGSRQWLQWSFLCPCHASEPWRIANTTPSALLFIDIICKIQVLVRSQKGMPFLQIIFDSFENSVGMCSRCMMKWSVWGWNLFWVQQSQCWGVCNLSGVVMTNWGGETDFKNMRKKVQVNSDEWGSKKCCRTRCNNIGDWGSKEHFDQCRAQNRTQTEHPHARFIHPGLIRRSSVSWGYLLLARLLTASEEGCSGDQQDIVMGQWSTWHNGCVHATVACNQNTFCSVLHNTSCRCDDSHWQVHDWHTHFSCTCIAHLNMLQRGLCWGIWSQTSLKCWTWFSFGSFTACGCHLQTTQKACILQRSDCLLYTSPSPRD